MLTNITIIISADARDIVRKDARIEEAEYAIMCESEGCESVRNDVTTSTMGKLTSL